MTARDLSPLAGGKLAFAAVVLSLANFMVVLDTTITNVAMPTISGDLGVSTTEGTWIITAYAVAEAITIPLTGWLSRRFGQVRVFATAVVAFVIFSICCGLATHPRPHRHRPERPGARRSRADNSANRGRGSDRRRPRSGGNDRRRRPERFLP